MTWHAWTTSHEKGLRDLCRRPLWYLRPTKAETAIRGGLVNCVVPDILHGLLQGELADSPACPKILVFGLAVVTEPEKEHESDQGCARRKCEQGVVTAKPPRSFRGRIDAEDVSHGV
jgi:hypothetical protein